MEEALSRLDNVKPLDSSDMVVAIRGSALFSRLEKKPDFIVVDRTRSTVTFCRKWKGRYRLLQLNRQDASAIEKRFGIACKKFGKLFYIYGISRKHNYGYLPIDIRKASLTEGIERCKR